MSAKRYHCPADSPDEYIKCFEKGLVKRNPHEKEFHQAVNEVAKSILPFIFDNKSKYEPYLENKILERLTEPDRIISFRVTWEDDNQNIRVNKGYRVQFNNSLGPYKGGLRFHPSVNQSILKFLGFEQIFKNSLTGLQIGGGKGGADFNPSGRSDREIMRFCQSYMTELYRHIGTETDVPAGDIGVGVREISYLFGQYKRIVNSFQGVLTGKDTDFGGSLLRVEATGYGLVYFAETLLKHNDKELEGATCLVSGAGNVSQHAVEKLIEKKAKVVSMSDSKGTIYVEEGINRELLEKIKKLKSSGKSLADLKSKKIEYKKGKTPWGLKAQFAFPCATQNELDEKDAKSLVKNKCEGVFEGANMPCTEKAIDVFNKTKVFFAPGKAANAGGVTVSGFEMSQNSGKITWERDKIDDLLKNTMKTIHDKCAHYGKSEKTKKIDYAKGANIAGFIKVADSMLDFGIN